MRGRDQLTALAWVCLDDTRTTTRHCIQGRNVYHGARQELSVHDRNWQSCRAKRRSSITTNARTHARARETWRRGSRSGAPSHHGKEVVGTTEGSVWRQCCGVGKIVSSWESGRAKQWVRQRDDVSSQKSSGQARRGIQCSDASRYLQAAKTAMRSRCLGAALQWATRTIMASRVEDRAARRICSLEIFASFLIGSTDH